MCLSQNICGKTLDRNIKLKIEEKNWDRSRNEGRQEGGGIINYDNTKSVSPSVFLCLASHPFQDFFFFPSLTLVSNKSGTQEVHCMVFNMDHSGKTE